jgi:hypothetical protein
MSGCSVCICFPFQQSLRLYPPKCPSLDVSIPANLQVLQRFCGVAGEFPPLFEKLEMEIRVWRQMPFRTDLLHITIYRSVLSIRSGLFYRRDGIPTQRARRVLASCYHLLS